MQNVNPGMVLQKDISTSKALADEIAMSKCIFIEMVVTVYSMSELTGFNSKICFEAKSTITS